MFGLDTAILMNSKVWEASGHTATFNDPLVEDMVTKKSYRLDHLLEENGVEDADEMSVKEMMEIVKDKKIKSSDGNELAPNKTKSYCPDKMLDRYRVRER